MNELICKKFERMGARVRFVSVRANWWEEVDRYGLALNIRRDQKGSYFEIASRPEVDIEVIDVRPKDRHLLLLALHPGDRTRAEEVKSKFLCGHDERDWFVAAIPENRPAANVAGAIEALKPLAVLGAQSQKQVKHRDKRRRKTAAYVRQGEWFFVPVPNWTADEMLILHNEPLQRDRSKPHLAEMLCRRGGETVYVNDQYPNGLTAEKYREVEVWARRTHRKLPEFRVMQRNAAVMVRGAVRHPDHKTIHLDGWHMVLPNTEAESRAMRNVAFLD